MNDSYFFFWENGFDLVFWGIKWFDDIYLFLVEIQIDFMSYDDLEGD